MPVRAATASLAQTRRTHIATWMAMERDWVTAPQVAEAFGITADTAWNDLDVLVRERRVVSIRGWSACRFRAVVDPQIWEDRWRGQGELAIRMEMERAIERRFPEGVSMKKTLVCALLAAILLWAPNVASAQMTCTGTTPAAPVANPGWIVFTMPESDFVLLTDMVVGVFAAGVTPQGTNYFASVAVPKAFILSVPNEPDCRAIKTSDYLPALPLPPVTPLRAALLSRTAKGDGTFLDLGWSPLSNEFKRVPPPGPATNVKMLGI